MTQIFNKHLSEVTQRTEALAPHSVAVNKKGTTIHRLRIAVPKIRRLVKEGYAFLSASSHQNLEIWDYIWRRSPYYEVMSQALYFYQHRNLSRKETRVILNWVERCTCWEHSDDLSKIYATVVEANPNWIVPTLKKWNRSENAWKRRQSMVSLIEYAGKRKSFLPFSDLMAFVEPLLDDSDYYVQKGLGWTLREIGNAYPKEFGQIMERHAADLAPQAWTSATKNLSNRDKVRLRTIRNA